MGHKQHQIHLKNLREGEQVLHNCSSHAIIHLKLPFFYMMELIIPFAVLMLLGNRGIFEDKSALVWFLYACYGLILTTYFFVRGVNFELGGCVITNQRLLLFGYRGLWQAVEREILPNKIEDFKIEKKGFLSLFFNTAYIYICTANDQTTVLRWVIEPEKIRDAYANMVKSYVSRSHSEQSTSSDPHGSAWIDEALNDPSNPSFNLETYRQGMIGNIGNVFKGKKRE